MDHQQAENKERKRRALIVTLVFHAILLVLFLLPALRQPEPLPEEIGVEIALADLGNSFTGSGEVTPTKVAPEETVENTNTEQVEATPPASNPEPQEEVVEDATSDESIAPANEAKKNTEKEPVEEKVVEEKPTPKPTVNKKALYPGDKKANQSKESGGSQGNRDGTGDMGSPTGDPAGKGVLGGGQGSWELSGRSLLRGATIEDTKEEGTVVLNIWVDRYGNVVRAEPNLAQSTTTSEYLFGLAKKAALRTRYSAKSDAAVEQKGKMTFVFILK